MRLLWVVVLVGCHAAAHPVSEPDIVARSHAFLAAVDRVDVPAVEAQLAPHYMHFDSTYQTRAEELAALAKRKPDEPGKITKRTWQDEHVSTTATSAIYIGRAREHQGGNDSHGGGYDFDGWYTLVWERAGARAPWLLALQTWHIAGESASRAVWDQIYEHGTGFEHAPNKLLVAASATHAPGTALDVAMGQGRNGLYLAEHGWTVTGVDLSIEGARQARTAAAQRGVPFDAVVADVTKFDYGVARYDLVAMIYAFPALRRIADLQRATKPGGLFVYEYFAPDGSPADDAPPPGALAKQFTAAGWDIVTDEIVEAVPDWALDRARIQRFVARKR